MARARDARKEQATVGGISSNTFKRRATVYDAVAGRVVETGLIDHVKDPRASKKPLRPDEVLFKQKNAPVRYEETDYYPAHTKLSADQQLPSGDLSGALHAYVSKLYAATERPGTQRGWQSMDETALIALTILMEETARGVLGETGDLAFTEAAEEDEEDVLARANIWSLAAGKERASAESEKQSTRRGKKRALAKEEPAMNGDMEKQASDKQNQDVWSSSDGESHDLSGEFD